MCVLARDVAGLRCGGGQHKPAAACGASCGTASPSAVAFSLSVASCCLETCDKSPNVWSREEGIVCEGAVGDGVGGDSITLLASILFRTISLFPHLAQAFLASSIA